jgi:uncharacterized protein
LPEFEILPSPIRIGLVSDTHLNDPRRGLPDAVLSAMSACDVIFHAGDVNRQWVLDALSTIAPVYAVRGNNDAADLQTTLPLERYFQVGAYRVGLIHGHNSGTPRPQTAKVFTFSRMTGVVDCVVYGHSHQPEIATRDGLLMINPGSPTQPRWAPAATYGVLDITETLVPRVMNV